MLESNSYASPYTVAAQPADVRATFIKKTYAHLGGALLAFAALEYLFLNNTDDAKSWSIDDEQLVARPHCLHGRLLHRPKMGDEQHL